MSARLRKVLLAGVLVSLTAGCSSHLSTTELEASNRSAAFEIVRSGETGVAAEPGAGGTSSPVGWSAAERSAGQTGVPAPPAGGGDAHRTAVGPAGQGGTGAAGSGAGRSATTASQGGAAPKSPGSGGPPAAQGGAPTAPGAPAGAPSGAEVVLGSVGTGSGPIGANVASIPVAVRAWAARVNADGGLGGRPVRVLFGDDGGDPGKALSLARKMVEEDHIVAFAGMYGPTTIQAVIPYATERNVPIVGGTSGNVDEDTSPIVYNPQAGLRAAGQAIVTTVAAQTPLTKVSVFYCREVQSCSFNRDAAVDWAQRHNISIVHEAQVSLAQPDFTAETVAARRAGAEAVVALVDLQSMIRLIRSAQRQGWQPTFGGSFAFDTADAEAASDILDGLLSSSLTLNWSASPKMAGYRDAVARYVPGGKLGGQGANTWAQGKLIEAAARHVSGPLTSAALIDGLDALEDETLGGIVPPQTFPKGKPHYNPCIVPIKLTGGKWTQPLGEKFVCD